MSDEQKGMGRRSLLLVLAIAGAVLVVAVIASLSAGWWKTRPAGNKISPEVEAYFGDLKDGSKLGRWTLVKYGNLRDGAIPVEMATADGVHFQLELMRRDPAGPKGVADTPALSIFLLNGADGGTLTPEEQGLGIIELAARLSARENNGVKPPELVSLSERLARLRNGPTSPRD